MSLLRFAALTRYFGADKIFGPIGASIEAGDAIGLIGRNGVGKTTLLRILAGIDQPDAGELDRSRHLRIGYMDQANIAEAGITLWDYAVAGLAHVNALAQQMRSLEQAIAAANGTPEQADLMSAYAAVSAQYEMAGGYSADAQARAALFGLGFAESQLEQKYEALSGGQKSRAALARLLLTKPDLLLLDEPTNHLDVNAIEWLEEYLRSYKGAFIVVSHDRAFLDAVTSLTWELEAGGLEKYPGNYTTSRALRAERRERQLAEYEAQAEQIAAMEAYIRRYKAGNRATMAKSREKALARMERIDRPPAESKAMRLQLHATVRSAKEVVAVEDVSIAFGSHTVLSNLQLTVRRGDRIGVAGPNGAGKSTLLKALAGVLRPNSGQVRFGKDVVIGYFSQELKDLNEENDIIDEILSARHMPLHEARSYLARFMFYGEDVFKKVGVLSGGEKNRLALAKLVLGESNLLLLDEPTNHLDIPAREALEEALSVYGGTLVFVSHDRYFLEKLAHVIWHVGEGGVGVYAGGYSRYRAMITAKEHCAPVEKAGSATVRRRQSGDTARAAARVAERAARQAAAALEELEAEIASTEAEKGEMERVLADQTLYADGEAAKERVAAYHAVCARLDALYAAWEAAAAKVAQET